MRYKFCPMCGTKLKDRETGDEGIVPYCTECDRLWFDTFSSCSIVLVANEYNEIVLLRQEYMSDKYTSFVSGTYHREKVRKKQLFERSGKK